PDINAAQLQKAASEGTSGKPGRGEFRKETAAPDHDLSGSSTDHRNLIGTVFGANSNGLHVRHRLELNTFRPIMSGPGVEERAGGAPYRTVHRFLCIMLPDPVKLFRRSSA